MERTDSVLRETKTNSNKSKEKSANVQIGTQTSSPMGKRVSVKERLHTGGLVQRLVREGLQVRQRLSKNLNDAEGCRWASLEAQSVKNLPALQET